MCSTIHSSGTALTDDQPALVDDEVSGTP